MKIDEATFAKLLDRVERLEEMVQKDKVQKFEVQVRKPRCASMSPARPSVQCVYREGHTLPCSNDGAGVPKWTKHVPGDTLPEGRSPFAGIADAAYEEVARVRDLHFDNLTKARARIAELEKDHQRGYAQGVLACVRILNEALMRPDVARMERALDDCRALLEKP